MRVFVILSAFLAAVSAANDVCYLEAQKGCGTKAGAYDILSKCNSKYGHFTLAENHLRDYVGLQLERSFDFLLMSTYFSTFEVNREGFQGYYRKMSDRAWEDAIDLIKFITKRGGEIQFKDLKIMNNADTVNKVFELNELESLSKALDMQKELAKKALHIYGEAIAKKHLPGSNIPHMDGSIAHYFEERFIEPQADYVRGLAGHINDLGELLKASNPSISLFMFDEYLKKSL